MAERARPGRPRSETARRKILAAALALLEKGGLAAVTMEAIAGKAKVGKPTIYRYWPNAQAVAMTALMEAQPAAKTTPRGSGLTRLRRHARAVAAAFSTPTGRSAAALIAASDQNTELSKAFRNHFVLQARAEGARCLETARDDAEISANADIETILDLIYGALFFRLTLGHRPLDAKFAEAAVELALEGARP